MGNGKSFPQDCKVLPTTSTGTRSLSRGVDRPLTYPQQRDRGSPTRPRVLLFEPNDKVLRFIGRSLGTHYDVTPLAAPAELFAALRPGARADLLLLAYDGVDASAALFEQVRALAPEPPLVALACAVEMADYEVLARFNTADVVLKPLLENLDGVLAKHLPAGDAGAPEVEESQIDETHSFVRSSKRMREIESQAALVARTDIPVLILGESGTGKEILATYTHKLSRRKDRMFLKINCAALPAELLESELFGYEEGAFTGAVRSKQGKFEIANGGTIFLDEIGEMPAVLQAKLLHVLQDGSFFRLGSRTATRCDVRVIAATNVNIKQSIAAKTFREDLYYRLNGLSLVLPPLRERLEELPALAAYFMRKAAARHRLSPLPLSPTLLAGFLEYRWPGNLRELENIITRFLVLQEERLILADLRVGRGSLQEPAGESPGSEDRGLKDMMRGVKGDAESVVIAGALEKTGWNRKAAAQDLQISYKALLYKIKQYELMPRTNTSRPAA